MFPDDYFVLLQEIVGFLQEFELYNYMTDWTKDKDPDEVREIYDKRTEELKDDVYYWERRNFEHKTTLEQTPEPVKEATTLVNLKKNKTHKVKRILPSTKHNYTKGTTITLLDQLDEHLSEGEANT